MINQNVDKMDDGLEKLSFNNLKIKHLQGVVTLIRCVEPFATGIKMKSTDEEVILYQIKWLTGDLNRRSSTLEE